MDTPPMIMKVYLRFNKSKILTIYHNIVILHNLSLSKVLDVLLGILTNNAIKNYETSSLLDSYTKVSVKD